LTVVKAGIVPPAPLKEKVMEFVPTDVMMLLVKPAGVGFEKVSHMLGANPVVLWTGIVIVPDELEVGPIVLETGGTIVIF